jgi:hypothetical protein
MAHPIVVYLCTSVDLCQDLICIVAEVENEEPLLFFSLLYSPALSQTAVE